MKLPKSLKLETWMKDYEELNLEEWKSLMFFVTVWAGVATTIAAIALDTINRMLHCRGLSLLEVLLS